MQYREQFNAMLAALATGQLVPPQKASEDFKALRYGRALKALRMRNLFVPTVGNFSSTNSNADYTTFTPPLTEDVIVCGCSVSSNATGVGSSTQMSGEIRIRPPVLMYSNYVQARWMFGPAAFSIYFPSPFILKAGEQIAVDVGFNAPDPAFVVSTAEQTVVFFCVAVKPCLSDEDMVVAATIESLIDSAPYQRKIYLNCTTPNSNRIDFGVVDPVPDGTSVFAETRVVSSPMLVLGLGTTLKRSQISIQDTEQQHSFTLNSFLRGRALFRTIGTILGPVSTGPYYSYFRFPVPHLLKPGATLACQVINQDDQAIPYPSQSPTLSFECLTP
jgi:hypothetical protein